MSAAVLPRSRPTPDVAPDGDFPLRVFFGHHKCATGWIDGVLREVCGHLGLRFDIVHQPHHYAEAGSLAAHAADLGTDLLAYTNADQQEVDRLPFHRGFHVVRDPRDVLVSAYYSHLHSHATDDWPELELHRDVLQTLSKKEGLLAELAFSRPVFEDMARWDYDQDRVLEVRMEALTAAPAGGFTRIFRHLDMLDEDAAFRPRAAEWAHDLQLRLNRLSIRGRRYTGVTLPVPRRRMHRISPTGLSRALRRLRFERLAGGRRKGQEDVRSHYRKGQPGDWQNHFDHDLRSAFKRAHPGLVARLGYAPDDRW